jgi:hypothetical protein
LFSFSSLNSALATITTFLNALNLNNKTYVYVNSSLSYKSFEIRIGTDANNYMGLYAIPEGLFLQKVQNGTVEQVWKK